MLYARIGDTETSVKATDFVRDYSAALAPFYKVAKLPESERPHCPSCGNQVHLYDIKNLRAGVLHPPKKRWRPNPGFVHYKAVPDCPYSLASDPRMADYVADKLFDNREREFNKTHLEDAKVRAGIIMARAYFMAVYSGEATLSETDLKLVSKIEKTFIHPMAGIGDAPWLTIFETMLLLPDRKRTLASGETATVGFRASQEKRRIALKDSNGEIHERLLPEYITLDYVTKRGATSASISEKTSIAKTFIVSRESAIDLWKRGKAYMEKVLEQTRTDPALLDQPALPFVPTKENRSAQEASLNATFGTNGDLFGSELTTALSPDRYRRPKAKATRTRNRKREDLNQPSFALPGPT